MYQSITHALAIAMNDSTLTDDELKHADAATRAFWRCVYELKNISGCDLKLALAAVEDADRTMTQGGNNHGKPEHLPADRPQRSGFAALRAWPRTRVARR